jgi:hypothetical protein
MIFFAMAGYYVFLATEQFNPKKIDQWLMILASISGTVIGAIAVGLLATLREKLGHRPRLRPRGRPASYARERQLRPGSILHCTQVRLGCI